MYYVGLDAHTKSFNAEILDHNGKLFKRFEVRGTRTELVTELKKVPGPLSVCFEASCGYGVLHEDLTKVAQTVKMAHPGHLRMIFACKRKNNRIDASKLAKILFLDAVPAVHVPQKEVRAWRQTIEFRQRLLGERVRVKNRVRALLREQGIQPPRSLWTKKGSAWMKELVLEDSAAMRRDIMLLELEDQRTRITRVEAYLKKIADRHPGITLLRTIPGVGPRTAEALIAYIDDIKRFVRIKSLGCYFGLIPCQDATGDKNRLGHITRDGPATVRKLLCEASWTAIRRSSTVRARFERVMGGDPQRKKIALVAVTHYLLRVAGAMLRTGQAWRQEASDAESAPSLPPSSPALYAPSGAVKVPPRYAGAPPSGRSTLTAPDSAQTSGHEGGRQKTSKARRSRHEEQLTT